MVLPQLCCCPQLALLSMHPHADATGMKPVNTSTLLESHCACAPQKRVHPPSWYTHPFSAACHLYKKTSAKATKVQGAARHRAGHHPWQRQCTQDQGPAQPVMCSHSASSAWGEGASARPQVHALGSGSPGTSKACPTHITAAYAAPMPGATPRCPADPASVLGPAPGTSHDAGAPQGTLQRTQGAQAVQQTRGLRLRVP